MLHVELPIRIKRRGVEIRLFIEPANGAGAIAKPDDVPIKAIARAVCWHDDLTSGRSPSIGAIADAEGISRRYVTQLHSLAFLAPDIIKAILSGRQPVDLTAEALVKHIDLPLIWDNQRDLLGFV